MGNVINKTAEPRVRKDSRSDYRRLLLMKVTFILACMLAILFLAGVSAMVGAYNIGFLDVYHIIWDGLFVSPDGLDAIVVWNIRMPRILMAILAGAGLGTAGALMQGILKNPLGDPFILGVSSGASFGAALALILGVSLAGGYLMLIGNAFIFALIPTAVIVLLTLYRKATPETLILSGVTMMYLFSAGTTIMMFLGSHDAMKDAYFWMVGSLDAVSWNSILPVFAVLIVCIVPIMWKSKDMNVMAGGDEVARSLGIKVEQTRVALICLSSLIAATVVAFTGPIGFIGLVSPNICRIVIGGDNRFLIPASASAGAALLLAADIVSRLLIYPAILQVGLITNLIGAPLFIYLIIKKRKEYW